MPAPIFTANADYIVIDRSPLVLEPGMRLKVGSTDRVWAGWVGVVAEDGRFTYIPESRIRMEADGSAVVKEKFDATDLSVRQGENIVSLMEVDGWHWARGPRGAEGWLPGYVLDLT